MTDDSLTHNIGDSISPEIKAMVRNLSANLGISYEATLKQLTSQKDNEVNDSSEDVTREKVEVPTNEDEFLPYNPDNFKLYVPPRTDSGNVLRRSDYISIMGAKDKNVNPGIRLSALAVHNLGEPKRVDLLSTPDGEKIRVVPNNSTGMFMVSYKDETVKSGAYVRGSGQFVQDRKLRIHSWWSADSSYPGTYVFSHTKDDQDGKSDS